MAYYDSSYDYGYDHHHGYHQTHFDVVPFPSSQHQNPICNATYGFNGSDFFNYGATNYCYNDAAITRSPMIGYSVFNFSEPKSLVYNPNSPMFSISQSVSSSATFIESEFNETEFEDFDSTPYGGGYDLDLKYGKPVLPSEKTCYPLTPPVNLSSPSLNNFSYSSIESPYGEDKEVQYYAGKPSSASAEQQPPATPANGGPEPERKPVDSGKGEDLHRNLGYGSELGNHDKVVGNHIPSGSESGNHEKVVGNHIPSGYGLEATDLCESLFGYWPCLERIKRRERSDRKQVELFGEECRDGNPWEGTVDYIFGSLNPYGVRNEEEGMSYGESMYRYQNHYQEQHLYLQQEQNIVEYHEYQ